MPSAFRVEKVSAGLASIAIALSSPVAMGQADMQPPPAGVVSDDKLTLVVGTRFVAAPDGNQTARALFNDARIPVSSFNTTDHCIDQEALKAAQEYFDALGRVLAKSGQYYFVPADTIAKLAEMCSQMHQARPQAYVDNQTKVIAFGRVVPTDSAAALELSIR